MAIGGAHCHEILGVEKKIIWHNKRNVIEALCSRIDMTFINNLWKQLRFFLVKDDHNIKIKGCVDEPLI